MNKQLEKEIPCSICYKKYKNIANHIRKHEISAEEYRKKYGETTYTRIIIKKINKLFVSERSKWLCGYYAKKEDQFLVLWRFLNDLVAKCGFCNFTI